MRKRLNNFINSSIFLSIVLVIVGLCLVFMPNITLKTFSIIAAVYLMIHGVFLMAVNIQTRRVFFPVDTLMSGILSLILGLVLLFYPNVLNVVIPMVLGIFIILHSINDMSLVITFKKGLSTGNFIITLLLAIFELILGILVLLNPTVSTMTMIVSLGLIIIIYSIINLIDMIIFKFNIKKMSKKFKKVIDDIEEISSF